MAERVFLALEIDAAARAELSGVLAELARIKVSMRPVAAENLHVTLKFLGDVAEADIPAVCAAVDAAATTVEPFELSLEALRARPGAGPLRMIWADVAEPTGRLAALHAACEQRLEVIGFGPEGRFYRPHVTLARINARGEQAPLRAQVAAMAPLSGRAFRVDGVDVMSSRLTPKGPVYARMHQATLAGADLGRRPQEP
jgi:RNA 2',3'-cyclic 3'-phosphodiesterase